MTGGDLLNVACAAGGYVWASVYVFLLPVVVALACSAAVSESVLAVLRPLFKAF
jgi:hypothetical protein